MGPNGWFKLHRDLLSHWTYDDPEKLKVWITLLSKATHKEHTQNVGYELAELQPGQLVFGLIKFAKLINISKSKLYRIIKLLEKDEMIGYDTETHKGSFSIITIKNWNKYQCGNVSSPTEQEEQGGSKKEVERVRNGSETVVKTNKNVKNVKNDKNNSSSEKDSDKELSSDEFALKKKDSGRYDYPKEYERLYSLYPFKRGNKKKGYKKWAARRRSGVSQADLLKAVKNYAAECKRKKTSKTYVMHIKRFFGPDDEFLEYLGSNIEDDQEDANQKRLDDIRKKQEEWVENYG